MISKIGKGNQTAHIHLPPQDYAKAKVICTTLQVNEFITTDIKDEAQFTRYLRLISKGRQLFSIKKVQGVGRQLPYYVHRLL